MEREEIIKFLENPKSYPHPVKKVKHFQTYISDVFLTGEFAYKIKKPVNYGYLDFTMLAKRKFFCRRELELNKRLSPQMYLSVLPIVKKETKAICRSRRLGGEGGLKFGGHGKVVEYVLKMKEIPQKYIMERQIKKGEINKKIIEKIAQIIAKFHKKAATSKKISFFGSLKIIKKNWQENFSQTRPFIGKTISQADFYFLKKSVEKFIIQNKKLFQQRIKNKKIRDGHGDLHTGNIFVTPHKIFIFDCIEFNQRFRYQDTASEVAFLAMDLDSLNRRDLSDFFVKKYIDYSDDKNLKKLLLFYKCYRAYVKGKVLSFSIRQFSRSRYLPNKIFLVFKKEAKKFFKLAVSYAKEWQKTATTETQNIKKAQKPVLIMGAGLPGIGRSTRLKILSRRIKAKILDSDIVRRQVFKKVKYDKKSKLLVYQKMMELAEKFLSRGKSVILDATFSKKIYRQLTINLAQKLKINYFLIEFYCSDEIAKQRLAKRTKEKSVSEADWQVYQKIKKEFELIKDEENHLKINTAKLPAENVKEILERIV